MKAISLSPDIKVEILEIGHQMNAAGLPIEFIAAVVSTAFEFKGVYDLLRIWIDEGDEHEAIADIHEMIDECSQQEKIEGVCAFRRS